MNVSDRASLIRQFDLKIVEAARILYQLEEYESALEIISSGCSRYVPGRKMGADIQIDVSILAGKCYLELNMYEMALSCFKTVQFLMESRDNTPVIQIMDIKGLIEKCSDTIKMGICKRCDLCGNEEALEFMYVWIPLGMDRVSKNVLKKGDPATCLGSPMKVAICSRCTLENMTTIMKMHI